MSHLAATLPKQVELGAIRHLKYSTEVVTTDGGAEVRNARWSSPLRTYDIAFPAAKLSDPIYQAVVNLYTDSLGGLHTFNFVDWSDPSGGTVVKVRFDSPLQVTGVILNLNHIDTLTLVEVR